jgi:hypothetical protein
MTMALRLRLAGALVVAVLLLITGSAGSANSVAPKVTFGYTGGEQSYVVPSGVVLLGLAVEGGHGGQYAAQLGEGGGRDGGVGALLPVTPHERLFVEVGSAGVYAGGPVFGGGGAAGAPPPVVCRTSQGAPCPTVYASSGGGASDVRTCSLKARGCNSLASRVIVGGGGGGQGGSGNGPSVQCAASSGGGRANSFQYPPGNAGGGPLPITTAAGIVYPGYATSDGASPGVTAASGGGASPGAGGRQAGCSSGGTGFVDSIPGSEANGATGGVGGNASSLGPMYSGCVLASNNCFDAGAGGGGGGGYFGGGGGATGLDKGTGNCGVCNGAGSGQGGGAGSSFVSRRMRYPVDESLVQSIWNGWAMVVPVIEIDAPVRGAVYHRGQVVRARYACGYDGQTGLGISQKCFGTVAEGKPISTTPGKHTFEVSGVVQSNGNHTVAATVTYRVK